MSWDRRLVSRGPQGAETPQALFDLLDGEFHFTLDACATRETAKCERFYTEEDNGLVEKWEGVVYVNPPHGDIGPWLAKGWAAASEQGVTSVFLLPCRTSTRWWHDWVMLASEIRFIKGRLRFPGYLYNAPYSHCVVVFKGVEGPPVIRSMART